MQGEANQSAPLRKSDSQRLFGRWTHHIHTRQEQITQQSTSPALRKRIVAPESERNEAAAVRQGFVKLSQCQGSVDSMKQNQIFRLTTVVSNALHFGRRFSSQSGPGLILSYFLMNLRLRTIATAALVVMTLAVSQFFVTSAYGQTPDQPVEPSGTHQPPDEDPDPSPETAAEALDGSGGDLDGIPQPSDTVSPRFVSAKSDGRSVVITFSENIFYSPLVRYVQEKYDVQIDRFVRATFDVTFDGIPVVLADGASISGNKLTVVLVQAHNSQQEIKIAYNNIFVRNSGGIFVDAAGTLCLNFPTPQCGTILSRHILLIDLQGLF